jgi:hypothetical protein
MDTIPIQTKLALQSLRGAQPMIVLTFLIIQRAMTIDELEEVTGLHNDTVRYALKGLKGKGLEMQRGAHGKQTWLLKSDTLFGLPEMSQSPKFSDSGPTATTIIGRTKLTDEVIVVARTQSPKFSDSEMAYQRRKAEEARQAEEDRKYRELLERDGIPVTKNLAMCKLMGIGEPMASQLSEMKHVTPDFIRDHVKSLIDGETLGLAIVRIRSDELPRLWLENIPTREEVDAQKLIEKHRLHRINPRWIDGEENDEVEND